VTGGGKPWNKIENEYKEIQKWGKGGRKSRGGLKTGVQKVGNQKLEKRKGEKTTQNKHWRYGFAPVYKVKRKKPCPC